MNFIDTFWKAYDLVFGALKDLIFGLLGQLIDPVLNALSLDDLLPTWLLGCMHSIGRIVDTFIPLDKFMLGMRILFHTWIVWMGFRVISAINRMGFQFIQS